MKRVEHEDAAELETREAARQLGVSFRELYGLIDARELPAYKVGRNIMVRQADVDAFRKTQPPGG
jgi:excisionase family DNA binding protein